MENSQEQNQKVVVIENGPYLVEGKFTFVDHSGNETSKEGKLALCRCGLSASKPFCDGTHRKLEWKS